MNEQPFQGCDPHGAEHKARRPSDRSHLLVSAWHKRQLPPRDYLLDGILSTTSRCLISGDTGVGKTLLALELGFAIAAGADFLNWTGVRPARVIYLDGEMPAETLKERIEAAAEIYGAEVQLYAYNRDHLGPDAMPPLNKPEGQVWLWKEIEAVKPDLIIFDSMMCLLSGPLSEEETWQPCLPLVRLLSGRRIAQVWLNHTGHDATRSFGSKTKEWEFDTAIMLSKDKDKPDDDAVQLSFTKARLRTPKITSLFKPQLIRRTENGWTTEAATMTIKRKGVAEQKAAWMKDVYFELATEVELTPGHNGASVRKVPYQDIRTRMVKRGYLEAEGNGAIPNRERTNFSRARDLLMASGFAGDDHHIWNLK